MRKKIYRPFLILGLVLLGLFYIPKGIVGGLRSAAIGIACKSSTHSQEEILEGLKTENLLLKNQNALLRRQLLSKEEMEKQLEKGLFSQYAEVIYRGFSHWNSTLWINLGERQVKINSPVLKGEYLIGLVEYVGKHKSRVRLLTDSSLVPSVRVYRNGKEYLAKGELYGSSSPLWRRRSEILTGIGFNYDFEDEEGPARELRSGKPITKLDNKEGVNLIEQGDLLVTTGMDGVFPKDIPVAYVTKLETLKEGAVSIEIKARLCVGNLDNLLDVRVLPPMTPSEKF